MALTSQLQVQDDAGSDHSDSKLRDLVISAVIMAAHGRAVTVPATLIYWVAYAELL